MKEVGFRACLLLLVTSLFCLFQSAYAVTIDKVVIFGDSLSDNGNIYSLTSKAHKVFPSVPVIPKSPIYYEGRFSNGPVWVDDLALALNVPLDDYAYGGAWAEPLLDSKLNVPFNIAMQVSYYLVMAVADFHKKDHLFIIWAGGNDYVMGRADADYATTNTVASIETQIEWLTYYGAKNILIMNLPDFSVVPEVQDEGSARIQEVQTLVRMHNEKLLAMVTDEQAKYPDAKIMYGDITTYFDDAYYHHEKYNIKNITTPCYPGKYMLQSLANNQEITALKEQKIDVMQSPSLRTAYLTAKLADSGTEICEKPDEYMFWDQIHPTRVLHHLMSLDAMTILAKNDIQGQDATVSR